MFADLVAFDLDDTLAPSKSPIDPSMADALVKLLTLRPVCIISGGMLQQFDEQVLQRLPANANLADLHLMPTCGTQYLRWNRSGWSEVYARNLTTDEKQAALAALDKAARSLELWEPDDRVFGDRLEDRGSQVTFSALGQRAPVELKANWDPTGRNARPCSLSSNQCFPNLR